MTKAQRREHNQRMAMAMKDAGIERTTGRCPVCNAVYHADFLRRGWLSHRCDWRS
jgi:hypothetical protein